MIQRRVVFANLGALVLILGGCWAGIPNPVSTQVSIPTHTTVPVVIPTQIPALTVEQARNATYAAAWDPGTRVELDEGRFMGDPFVEGGSERPQVMLVEPVALGDLNADGWGDAGVILASSGGGSGTFYSLEVLLDDHGTPVHAASLLLGDRIQVEAFGYEAAQLVLLALRHSSDDPLCCPSLRVETRYELEGGELLEVERQVLDDAQDMAPPTLEAPEIPPEALTTVVWGWYEYIDNGEVNSRILEEPEKYVLVFLPEGYYRVTLSCYSGQGLYTVQGSRLQLEIDPQALSACPEGSEERAYLHNLGYVVAYVQAGEYLFLNLIADAGSMVLEPLE